VKAFPAYGHTPGHSNYVAESKGQKMMFWGDLMHVAAVQFKEPSVTIQFDSDPKAAPPARRPMPPRPRAATTWPSRTSASPASAGCAPTARAMTGCR
jgi:glyoxylase-like metal-dependent hydrolase (beta-lactamase superfamily II)